MLPILQPAVARDPVCGMQVDPQKAAGSVEYQGKTYHFCSKGCVAKFQADPEKYLYPESTLEPKAYRSAPRAASNTLARCIRKSGKSGRARAPSAAWLWSR